MRIRSTAATALAALLMLTACGANDDSETSADAGGTDETTDEADEGDEDEGAEDEGAEDEGEASGEPTEVLFVSFTNDITEMAGQQLIGMERQFEEDGFAVEIGTAAPAGAEDNEGMDTILEDVVTIDPDYLVVVPSSYSLVEDRLLEIQEAGISTIVVNFFPGMLEEEPQIDPLAWITVDEYTMGYNGGEWMAQKYCDEGRDISMVPFYGPAASEISQQRLGGALDAFEEVMGACGQTFEVEEDIFAEFDRQLAFNFAEGIATKYPDLDLIIGANSNTALGVMEALIAQGRIDDVDVLGMGGQLDELAAICRGDITAAGFRNSVIQGNDMAKTIMANVAGEEVDKVVLSDIPVVHDCETVFEEMPEFFQEFDGFRRNIPDDLFEQYAG